MATAPNPTQVTEYQTGFAPVIAPYAERLLGRAEAMFEDPYMQYQGERFAQFTPLQQQAFAGAQAMEAAPQLRDASAMAGTAGLQALAYNKYRPAQFGNFYQAVPSYQPTAFNAPGVNTRDLTTYQMGPADRVSADSLTGQGVASRYMSPYIQNVVDIQQREAQRQADIASTARGQKYARAGAFGGARQAIENAEAARNLAMQKGDIQSMGLQQAYQQAQHQFNAEQAARLQAQLANQQAGITMGGQNLQAALGVQQLGAQQDLQARLAEQQARMQAQQMAEQSRQFGYGQLMQQAGLGAQYGQAAAQLGEQSRQYGAGLGLQGLQTALQSAGQLGQLGQNQFGQNLAINQLQAQYGGQQQQQMQNILGSQYQDFLNYQNYPYKQLGFMSDILRGAPLSQTGAAVYQQPPSMLSQVAGVGAVGRGFGLFAEGGQVDSRPAGLADLAIYNMGR
jgi:hypothetical protein